MFLGPERNETSGKTAPYQRRIDHEVVFFAYISNATLEAQQSLRKIAPKGSRKNLNAHIGASAIGVRSLELLKQTQDTRAASYLVDVLIVLVLIWFGVDVGGCVHAP
jgi:hypothetical protein